MEHAPTARHWAANVAIVVGALAIYHVLFRGPAHPQGGQARVAADVEAIRADLRRLAERLDGDAGRPEGAHGALLRRLADLEARAAALDGGAAGSVRPTDSDRPGGAGAAREPGTPEPRASAGAQAWTPGQLEALRALLAAADRRERTARETEAMRALLVKVAPNLTPSESVAALGPMLAFREAFHELRSRLPAAPSAEERAAYLERVTSLRSTLVAELSLVVPPSVAESIGAGMPPRPLSGTVDTAPASPTRTDEAPK